MSDLKNELAVAGLPHYCPSCSEAYSKKDRDVKPLESEHAEQVRWHCFCGICGMVYTIEVES